MKAVDWSKQLDNLCNVWTSISVKRETKGHVPQTKASELISLEISDDSFYIRFSSVDLVGDFLKKKIK